MARTDNRLDLDANLVGYWGFDEALESDNAIDESTYADAHLTVTGSPSVQLGRVGSARTLSSSAYASVTLARLLLTGDGSILGWFKLNSVNNSGSLLRAFVSCGGPTTGDNQLFGVYVDNGGRLVYKHSSASGEVIVRTRTNVIRINQFYNIAVLRSAGGTQVQFIVDNFNVPVVDVTVNGSPSALPVPAPSANASAIFSVGRSQKESDSAFWDGLVDEVSLHNIARTFQPYTKSAYFRAALRTGTRRLSSTSTVVSVSSSDMGSGVRWWCYERDKELYVVKESPFGLFGPETQLTTVSGPYTTSATRPELVYDPASDTLLVIFAVSNRIYKLTASSTDDPATINMPLTADAGSIIKLVDNVELYRGGEGYGGQREWLPTDYTSVNRPPVKISVTDATWNGGEGYGGGITDPSLWGSFSPHPPTVAFATDPVLGFGIVVAAPDSTQYQYASFTIDGGLTLPFTTPVLTSNGYKLYFVPITSRVYLRKYVIESKDKSGKLSYFSEVLEDRFLEPRDFGAFIQVGPQSGGGQSMSDSGSFGEGYGGQREWLPTDYTTTNRTPLKFALQETGASGEGYGGQQGSYLRNGLTVTM